MFARSLFSLLAVATVAVQTCAAISDGPYRISLSNGDALGLLGPGDRGEPVRLLPPYFKDTWKIQNHEDKTITILHSKSRLYLAPRDQVEKGETILAVVSDKKFFWRLQSAGEDRMVIERADGGSGDDDDDEDDDSEAQRHLVLSQSPSWLVEISKYFEGYEGQEWEFERVDGFRHKTETHCGPWRFPRDSLQFQ
ncbi:hypothetical protein BGZ70_001240 [Mortierella alpina]|uniref:Uncharacterized protein n=1 Tax=Mortierella alpina TaxID=64518 RepID=A0A9P6LX61_MORAP|nr:hypothetical protein BGZ70_001240 [Mortierella alpina]